MIINKIFFAAAAKSAFKICQTESLCQKYIANKLTKYENNNLFVYSQKMLKIKIGSAIVMWTHFRYFKFYFPVLLKCAAWPVTILWLGILRHKKRILTFLLIQSLFNSQELALISPWGIKSTEVSICPCRAFLAFLCAVHVEALFYSSTLGK